MRFLNRKYKANGETQDEKHENCIFNLIMNMSRQNLRMNVTNELKEKLK